MSVTLQDIAKKSNLTPSAVSKILNPKGGRPLPFSAETRRRVIETAQAMGYQPNKLAQSMAIGKTYTLGFLCGDFHTPYFSELAMATMLAAEKHGYHMLISVTQWDKKKETQAFDALIQRRVEGIILAAGAVLPGSKCYDYIARENFPVVMPGHHDEFCHLRNEWQEGFDQAVAHLASKGHRRIGMVYQELPKAVFEPKYPAFLAACKKCKMESISFSCQTCEESINLAVNQIVATSNRPTAIIVFSDYMAMSIIRGLRKNGLSIPRDMAVIGVDGTHMGEIYHPALTTIDVDIPARAQKSVELLLSQIDGRSRPNERGVLPTRLIVRESA